MLTAAQFGCGRVPFRRWYQCVRIGAVLSERWYQSVGISALVPVGVGVGWGGVGEGVRVGEVGDERDEHSEDSA